MNIQIFGTKKNFDSKKAERYFKERGIKYQFIDMKEKGLSKGEFQSVCQAIGGYDKLIDTDCKDKDLLALITYIAEEDKAEKILENQSIIKVPVVRNGKQATVGYQPEIWNAALSETPYIKRDEAFVNKKILLKQGEHFQVQYEYEKTLTAPVRNGQKIGEIRYYLDDTLYYKESIHVPDSIDAITLPYCIRQSIRHFLLYTST